MGPSRVLEAEIYASHMQFYVVDPDAEYRTDLVWHGSGLERHLGVSPGIVAVGTVDVEEAKRRYGPRAGWGRPALASRSAGQMLKNIVQTIRYSRGWRPESDTTQPVDDAESKD